MLNSVKKVWDAYSEDEKKKCAFLTAIIFLSGVVFGILIAPAKKNIILIGNSGNKINDRRHRKEER